ncbi:MAG: hypothetical protein J5819_03160 [Eubacterium sp.]|nr:hypothetical protein [Eubacterium sp.]
MRKAQMRTCAVMMTFALAVGGVTVSEKPASAAEKAVIVSSNMTVSVGQSSTIMLKKKVSGATYSFKSKDTGIATVTKKGKVTGKKEGSTKIVVKQTKDEKTVNVGTVKVKVTSNKKRKAKEITVPIYGIDTKKFSLYFVDGGDIPYLSEKELIEQLTDYFSGASLNPDIKLSQTDSVTRLDRKGQAIAEISYDENSIWFSDENAFFQKDENLIGNDQIKSNDKIFKKDKSVSTTLYGNDMMVNLGAYGIELVQSDKGNLIPLQTLNDFFFQRMQLNFLYNGEYIFVTDISGLDPEMAEIYHKTEKKTPSKEFAEYNYNELCIMLDHRYGLKDTHGITCFADFFRNSGLMVKLKSTDVSEFEEGLYELINVYIDDLHTRFLSTSCQSKYATTGDIQNAIGGSVQSISRNAYFSQKGVLKAARDKNPNAGLPYYELGDTAYISFDDFEVEVGSSAEYTAVPGDLTEVGEDTVKLMMYAHSQIRRANSPIKNVVLDLSTNGGGTIYAAVYLVGTFLGKAAVATKDTITNAMTYAQYYVDNNLDGVFDDKDTFTGLNLYCLTSRLSFSSGNFVSCAFKDSGKVTMIGQTSGGGSCALYCASTAYGSIFNISSPWQFSFYKNGSFYNVDRGADPDVYIRDLTKLYDREYVNALIKKID